MRTMLLIYILFILLIINIFKTIGVFKEEIEFYTNYITMEIFSGISTYIVDNEIERKDNE